MRLMLILLSFSTFVFSNCWGAVFIDPDSQTTGDGSIGNPYNSWSYVEWVSSEIYLQKRGTTYEGEVIVEADGIEGHPIIIGSYGDGAKPIIDGETYCINLSKRSYVTVQGFNLDSAIKAAILLTDGNNITIQWCEFDDPHAEYAIFCQQLGTNEVYNISILNNTFENYSIEDNGAVHFRRSDVNFVSHHIIIDNNKFKNLKGRGISITSLKESMTFPDRRPYNITISNNFFENLTWSSIKFAGATDSYINNNKSINIGKIKVGNKTNTYQLHWTNNTIIEYNIIDTTYANIDGDGTGIILDKNWSDSTYKSSNCKVRFNKVSNCQGAGISVFAGTNNKIYSNVVFNNSYGLKVTHNFSTENSLFNNTTAYNTFAGILGDHEASLIRMSNNLIVYNERGIHLTDGSTEAIEINNIFYDNVTSNYTIGITPQPIDSSDLDIDPLLTTDFILAAGSPALGAGCDTGITGEIDLFGNIVHEPYNIGAYSGSEEKETSTSTSAPETFPLRAILTLLL